MTSIAGLYLSYWFNVASGATIVLVQIFVFLVGPGIDGRSECKKAPIRDIGVTTMAG